MAELNGRPISVDDLKALALTNYGHFTSMRVDDGRVRGLSLHMDRLSRDCRIVFEADLDCEYVLYLIRKVAADLAGPFVIRVTIFDPKLEMGHLGVKAEPKILVTSRSAGALDLPPLRVQSVRYMRDMPQVKHVGLMGSLRCRRAAQLNGYDDAVFVDSNNSVTEGVTWNIGFFDGARVIWPQGDILPGITAALLNAVHSPSAAARVNVAEIHGMVAAFAMNTSIGVRPISAIDGHEFEAGHSVISTLRDEYAAVEGERL
jgi:branched-subunit amino acid aminotransferase/4-amino-4-deoxychorismate lyase